MRPGETEETLDTLTHARLRVGQGDLSAAAGLLRRILERDPDHAEARELLGSIEGRCGPERAGPATGRKIARLERWLRRIRGEP